MTADSQHRPRYLRCIMTSSDGNNFRVTGPFCWEFTGHRWIPRTKASDAELWCFPFASINGSVNNREASEFRCQCAHYDVTVMDNRGRAGKKNDLSATRFSIWLRTQNSDTIYSTQNVQRRDWVPDGKRDIKLKNSISASVLFFRNYHKFWWNCTWT